MECDVEEVIRTAPIADVKIPFWSMVVLMVKWPLQAFLH